MAIKKHKIEDEGEFLDIRYKFLKCSLLSGQERLKKLTKARFEWSRFKYEKRFYFEDNYISSIEEFLELVAIP